jgi:hypothetical protein
MSEESAKTLAVAFVTGCAFIMLGLVMSKPKRIDTYNIGYALQELAESAPHAACINKGWDWEGSYCREK